MLKEPDYLQNRAERRGSGGDGMAGWVGQGGTICVAECVIRLGLGWSVSDSLRAAAPSGLQAPGREPSQSPFYNTPHRFLPLIQGRACWSVVTGHLKMSLVRRKAFSVQKRCDIAVLQSVTPSSRVVSRDSSSVLAGTGPAVSRALPPPVVLSESDSEARQSSL